MLTLSILRCPDNVPPQTRTVQGGEFAIGRGPENDWVLSDPDRDVSRRHCLIAYRAGVWELTDLSTNGTFLNHEKAPVGRGVVRALKDGDRLSFGPYEIEVRITAEQPATAATPFVLDPFAAPGEPFPAPPAPPAEASLGFGQDPLLGAAADDPRAQAFAPPPITLPPDFDPLAPEAGEAPLIGPTQPDHSPSLEDAFRPPRVLLPEDWDRDFSLRAGAAASAAGPPQTPSVPEPAPAPAAVPAATASEEALLAAFLRGAGIADARPSDPVAAMEGLGAAFRAFVCGLRQALIARLAIKREFRIETTMLKPSGNNPLKFSANDEDALIALIGAGRRTDMGAAEAVADAMRDMRLHELAMLGAMQAAVRGLLAEFDPAKLRQGVEKGGLNFVAVKKKAQAWDAFEALHARITAALADDFDSVFGKTFAQAYERALAEAREEGR
jgi:type VI secretion system FHA domain protein